MTIDEIPSDQSLGPWLRAYPLLENWRPCRDTVDVMVANDLSVGQAWFWEVQILNARYPLHEKEK